PLRALPGLLMLGLDPDLGLLRLLVGIGHAGELLDLAPEGLLVQPLDVAARTLVDRRVDEDLDELTVLVDHLAGLLPRLTVRGGGRDDDSGAVARQARRDPADAVDVRVPVLL